MPWRPGEDTDSAMVLLQKFVERHGSPRFDGGQPKRPTATLCSTWRGTAQTLQGSHLHRQQSNLLDPTLKLFESSFALQPMSFPSVADFVVQGGNRSKVMFAG